MRSLSLNLFNRAMALRGAWDLRSLIMPTYATNSRGYRKTVPLRKDDNEIDKALLNNPYYAKYSEKISQLQKKFPDEFLTRVTGIQQNEKIGRPRAKTDGKSEQDAFPGQNEISTKKRSLDSILKLDQLKDKSAEEISELWIQYFHEKADQFSTVITAHTFRQMQSRFNTYNTFIFPIARRSGYEFAMMQFLANEAHFTTLINYQVHKEYAPECLNMIYFTELMETKGIVLMLGEFDCETLDEGEANLLAIQTIQYYGGNDEKKLNHLNRFSNDIASFNHLDLIAQLEADFPALQA